MFRSADGRVWTESPSPLAFNPAVMARSDDGTLVTLDETGGDVHRSTDDGKTWVSGTSSSAHAHGLTDLVFGYGKPSESCPN